MKGRPVTKGVDVAMKPNFSVSRFAEVIWKNKFFKLTFEVPRKAERALDSPSGALSDK